MTTTRLIKLIDRIKFWYEMSGELQTAYQEAMDTIIRTDVDVYKQVTQEIADRNDTLIQFAANRLKTAVNELKNELNHEPTLS
jgi:hypothetical protein